MRLTPEEVAPIKTAASEAFGPTAVARLFGSRVRDDLRGGDLDLHIALDQPASHPLARHGFCARLFVALGERWPDLIISSPGPAPTAIEHIALRDGIVL